MSGRLGLGLGLLDGSEWFALSFDRRFVSVLSLRLPLPNPPLTPPSPPRPHPLHYPHQFVASKPSSLKKKANGPSSSSSSSASASGRSASDKTFLRKVAIHPDTYSLQTSFTSKTEAVVYYPKLPRAWVQNGLLLVPCLSEKAVKGGYDLEVHCSESINVRLLPDSFSRSLASEWTEAAAGGSHLQVGTWKRNPKFSFYFKNSSVANAPARVRITLARHGSGWKSAARKDPVGCMIGFYVFIQREGLTSSSDLIMVYEAPFLPNDENSTGSDFQLDQLPQGDEYVIMPATFADGKFGSFVLSVMADYEFSLKQHK